MESSRIRVDVGVAADLRAMPAEQRLGMKGHWDVVCYGPRPDYKRAYLQMKKRIWVARAEALAALRPSGRTLHGGDVRIQNPVRYWLARAKWALTDQQDPAIAAIQKLHDLQRVMAKIPLVEKWRDTIENIVVNAGLNHILDIVLSGGTQITSWFMGLLSATPTVAAGDTMSSHAGWTEVVAFDESTRVAFVDGGASSQSLSNSGSPAVFTISTNGTGVGGAFLTSGSAKSGTTGTLYAAGAFTAGNKDLDDGDTLTVTLTATAAAA